MSGGAPVPKRRPRVVDGPTQFAQTAKRVGFTLRRAAGLVGQLHGLVQRRSLVFGDPTDQVEQLTTAIKTDRLAIEKGIEALLSAVPGSPRPRSHGAHCAAVIKVVRDQFIKQDMAFKAALETRSENLKQQRAQGQKFYNQPSAVAQLSAPLFARRPAPAAGAPVGAAGGAGQGGGGPLHGNGGRTTGAAGSSG